MMERRKSARAAVTCLDLHEAGRTASRRLEGIRSRRRRLDHSREPHENASPASHPAGTASHRHPGRASHAHRAIRLALSRRAVTRAAAIGKHVNAALRRLGYAKDDMSSHGFRAAASRCSTNAANGMPTPSKRSSPMSRQRGRKAYARAEYWDERVEMMACGRTISTRSRRADRLSSFGKPRPRREAASPAERQPVQALRPQRREIPIGGWGIKSLDLFAPINRFKRSAHIAAN